MNVPENKQLEKERVFQAIDIVCEYCHYAGPIVCNQCPVSWTHDDLIK